MPKKAKGAAEVRRFFDDVAQGSSDGSDDESEDDEEGSLADFINDNVTSSEEENGGPTFDDEASTRSDENGARHLEAAIRKIERRQIECKYKHNGLAESKKWPEDAFTSGICYPAPRNKVQMTQWSSRLNALIRTDLQNSLPAAQPKGRIPENFYWEPEIGGWRRTKDLTDTVPFLRNPHELSVNFGKHLDKEIVEGVSITIGLKGAHLPRSYDPMILNFFKDHFLDFHIAVEFGGDTLKKKNANEHRHYQCYAVTHLVKDKATETEIVEAIKKKCGLPKGHRPPSNIVARICESKDDNMNMLGYVQKERDRSTYFEATTFSPEQRDEAFDLRQHIESTAVSGKKELLKTNVLDEAYKFWHLHASPLQINFMELVTVMVNTGKYQLSKTFAASPGFDGPQVESLWAVWTSPGAVTSSTISTAMLASKTEVPLVPAIPKLNISTLNHLKRKVRDHEMADESEEETENNAQMRCALSRHVHESFIPTERRNWRLDFEEENDDEPRSDEKDTQTNNDDDSDIDDYL